jgi:PmbA protein
MIDDLLNLASDVVARAKRRGADAADALAVDGRSLDVSIENRKVEKIEQSESRDVGLRVFVGQSSAIISSGVMDPRSLDQMVERAIDMAKLAPPDEFAGIADSEQLARSFPALDLVDTKQFTATELQKMAEDLEEVALAVPGVTKSAGSGAYSSYGAYALATSNGFSGGYDRSTYGYSVSAIAGSGTNMERDYDGHGATHFSDVEPIEKIGRTAGERAVKRLNPRKLTSQSVPIIYDRRVATSLVSHCLGAINGASVARGTSFLKGDLGKRIFRETINIIDDPLRVRGSASKPFDGEGLPVKRRHLIENGMLPSWIMDLRAARKLKMTPSGQGSRGLTSPPGPTTTNVYMEAGSETPESMIKSLKKGLLVNEFIGSTVNMVTGDYSRGASGFWIENGEIAYPVSEITIAGNLRDMFMSITPASDLIFRGSFSVPSCLVEGMTIAGK